MTIHNAKITSIQLGPEDHGIMTFMLHLETSSFNIGYGGYALDWRDSGGDGVCLPIAHAYQAIRYLLDTLAVPQWERLPNTLCRIDYDDGLGCSGKIRRIGHIMEDRWFDLAAYMTSDPANSDPPPAAR